MKCQALLMGKLNSLFINMSSWSAETVHPVCQALFYLFIYFDMGFTALSKIFHLYRADRSSKLGENRRTRGKTT